MRHLATTLRGLTVHGTRTGIVKVVIAGRSTGAVLVTVSTFSERVTVSPPPEVLSAMVCCLLSHGTGTLPLPLAGKPAAAGRGWPSTENETPWVFLVVQVAGTWAWAVVQTTSAGIVKLVIDGVVGAAVLVCTFTTYEAAVVPSP